MSGPEELEGKTLLGQVAFRLQDDGWYVATVITTQEDVEDYEIARIRSRLLLTEELQAMWRDLVMFSFEQVISLGGGVVTDVVALEEEKSTTHAGPKTRQ